MRRNGSMEVDDVQPPDTGSMWANMFGMGSLFKLVTDPDLQAHAHEMMNAIIQGAQASIRIEQKLDALLGGSHGKAPAPALPVEHGPTGTGGGPVAVGFDNNGTTPDRGQTVASGNSHAENGRDQ